MSAFRALGALLCAICVVIIFIHIGAGYFGWPIGGESIKAVGYAFGLPVSVGLVVVCGLGFWLGWIMATTREAVPSPEPIPERVEEEGEKGVIEELTSIKGVTEPKAQTLIDEGFDDLISIRAASTEDLTRAKGIGPALAERIKEKLAD